MISFKPHITPDSFFHETSPASSLRPSPSWPITIYFITGNPGLISYYHAFLSLLGKKIVPGQDKFHIIGHSLAGFELEPDNAAAQNETQKQKQKHVKDPQLEHEHEHYYDVEEQICFVQGRLEAHMRALRADSAGTTTPTTDTTRSSSLATSSEKQRQSPRPKVILIGHSVGTYMAMEILRRHRERQETAASENNDFDIIGGVMLFPTVMDIASSPAGQKLMFLLRLIPQLALVVSFFARILTAVLPNPIIRTLVKFVMRSPPDAAVDATVSFLKSKRGVRQALHMGADEMRTITTDKWSDDVWGVSRAPEPQSQPQLLTRLFFYFGRNDHWVAEQTREEIVAARGATTKAGPRMIVCEESLPHAFCLKHNETMAHKVADMIQEIIE
ncbi:hypothetical protein BDW62DRAFT_218427 [Aspergillus aurantiobrunneus]